MRARTSRSPSRPGSRVILATALAASIALASGARGATVLVEAESFTDHGGWSLDTQFIPLMGSPYLLAHGLGEPVDDAVTTVSFPREGTYRVFARTKDWVARWKAPGAPGRFQVLVDGEPLKETFGTRGAEWGWQAGGTVAIRKSRVTIALRDLTGFDGRCDAILFTDEPALTPPNDPAPMAPWRRQWLGLSDTPAPAGPFDLVVVGGGYGGMGAAVSGARAGCRVALIQDRPVLGGNGSAEVRVWPQGLTRRGLFPRVGEIVEELADRPTKSPGRTEEFTDAKREAILRAEPNLTLFLNHCVFQVETHGPRIVAVVAMDTRTGALTRFAGRLFADCTGHGTLGVLAGADHATQERGHMGMSNMWRWKDTGRPEAFPETPWALALTMKDFPYPKDGTGPWFWESGFDLHPIDDLEHMRDWNLRAVFGAFNAMKNGDGRDRHANAKLEWVAYIGGPRESRQLLGDVVLTREDIVGKKPFPDGCVPTTWDIDLHYPKQEYTNAAAGNPFISRAEFGKAVDRNRGYPVPYRAFYSRNVRNLFMAGRCISVTHEALGTVRVMKTGGMMGEVVGKAASLCVKHDCLPADIYPARWEEMAELLNQPGAARRGTVVEPLRLPPGIEAPPLPAAAGPPGEGIDPASLRGLVIDDTQAKLTGRWQDGQNLKGFVGVNYRYHAPRSAGAARYEFKVDKTGRYEIRMSYQHHENRATNTRVIVNCGGESKEQRINQRQPPPLEKGFVSLGVFEVKAGEPCSVVIDTDEANGNVGIDAVQVLPAP